MIPGLSTLGMKLSYAAEATAGTKPESFTVLHRIASVGGVKLEPNTIDASAIEDTVDKTVAGRASTGGSWTVKINYTSETATEWTTLISAYNTAKAAGKQMWFQVSSASLTNSWFVVAEPPQALPMPEIGANELLTMEISLTIADYKGLSTKVNPTDSEA